MLATQFARQVRSAPLQRSALIYLARCNSTKADQQPFTREQIMDRILDKVPSDGFEKATNTTLQELGYSDAARNLFPKGSFDIIKHHLEREKAKLAQVPLPENASIYNKVAALISARLMANVPALGDKLSDSLAIVATGSNIKESLEQLHSLSDEIWFLAADRSTDTSWYTRRAAVSSIYASAELFMAQDTSAGFRDTLDYVKRRVRDLENAEWTADSVVEWLSFSGLSAFNVLKSLTR